MSGPRLNSSLLEAKNPSVFHGSATTFQCPQSCENMHVVSCGNPSLLQHRGLKQLPLQCPVSVTGSTALPRGLPSPAGLRVHSRRHRISVGYQVTTDQEGSGSMVRCWQGQMVIPRTPAWAQHTQKRGLLQCSRPTSSEAPPRTSECGAGGWEEGDEEKLVNDLELATAQPEGMRTYGISELAIVVSNFRN